MLSHKALVALPTLCANVYGALRDGQPINSKVSRLLFFSLLQNRPLTFTHPSNSLPADTRSKSCIRISQPEIDSTDLFERRNYLRTRSSSLRRSASIKFFTNHIIACIRLYIFKSLDAKKASHCPPCSPNMTGRERFFMELLTMCRLCSNTLRVSS